MARLMRRYWLAFAIPVAFVLLWVLVWNVPQTRSGLQTVLLIQDLMIDVPYSPLKVLGDEPLREEAWIDAPLGRGQIVADIYRPDDGDRHATILMSVGAAEKIRDHEGIIRLSTTFARAGIVMVIPALYYPYEESALPEDVHGLVDAFGTNIEEVIATFSWLRDQPYVDPERIAIFGVSAGGGVGLIAAADQRIRDDIYFFAALGSYYDMVDLISAITTESISYNGHSEVWEPKVKAVRVLHRSIISFLADPLDRSILTRIFLGDDTSARDEVASLTEQGREVYEAFETRDAERILAFWNRYSPRDVAALRDISPSQSVGELHTELFIMTDRSDPYIPYVESRRLRDAVSGNGIEIHYVEFDFLEHVEPESPTNPVKAGKEVVKLLYYLWVVMQRLD